MRSDADALSGLLSVLQLDRNAVWRSAEFAHRASSPRNFETHIAAVCKADAAGAAATPRGMRTTQRLARRVAAREAEWTRRTVQDLARLADLHDRMRLREAEAERRRCFVLGRLLLQAARTDPRWQDTLALLVRSAALRPGEARVLGLSPPRQGKARRE